MQKPFQASRSRRSAFTLVETMVAMFVVTACALGFYTTLMRAYELTAIARYHDNARVALRSYADQFQRLPPDREFPAGSGLFEPLALFTPTTTPTGRGLRGWGQISDALNIDPQPNYVTIPLGASSNQILARITRDVRFVRASDGTATTTPDILAAGLLLQATFEITYQVSGQEYRQRIVTMRANA